ncbi:tetratricopeptide repeat protein [Micromonospora violae]|uniref:tetratricopeptide repeat protein n=1 Tax=Micromonospora violae TaxID=1278207 RepID=UPI0033D60B48
MQLESGNGDDAVARARELVLAKQFEPAVALLREHLTTHPDDGVGWRRLAGALIGLDEEAAAVGAASRAIEINPEDAVAYRYRALAHQQISRYRESYVDAKRAVELAPDDHEALSLLALNVLAVGRDTARFKELIQRALTVNPDSATARGALKGYREIQRRTVAVAASLAAFPVAVVLLCGWFAVDTGRSSDARWMIWPGIVAVTAMVVLAPLTRSAGRVFPTLTLTQVSTAAIAAGVIAAGAGYGATRAVPAAAALGLLSVAISGLSGIPLSRRGARKGTSLHHAGPETDLSRVS